MIQRIVGRGVALALLTSVALFAGIHPAHASLAFCRTDPTVTFKTADGQLHQVLLSAHIATDKANVQNVSWTVTLPAASNLIQVSRGGPLKESVSIDSDGVNGSVGALADVQSNVSAEVDVQGQLKHVGSSSVTASGTTNAQIALDVSL